MIARRSFLIGAGTITVAQLLSGCSRGQTELNVELLKGSIPSELVTDFRSTLTRKTTLKFKTKAQLQDLYNLLQTSEKKVGVEQDKTPFKLPNWKPGFLSQVPVDLVTIGNYHLPEAIAKNLIQPIEVKKLSGWENLPTKCQKLVQQDGKIWGAPYRWGFTLIAYRRDKFKSLGWTPTDWSDLWKEELRDRISLLDQPREVIGLTLKKLGASYNTPDLSQVSDLKSQLQALHQQVKFYSSKNYLQPLILKDSWLAVGWSNDILPLQSRVPEIQVVIPRSGTALWADLWVKPASNNDPEQEQSLIQEWINFCWQPPSASKISLLTSAASPIINKINPADLPKDIRNNPLLLPNSSVIDKSEFINPLSDSSQKQYLDLWKEIRTARN